MSNQAVAAQVIYNSFYDGSTKCSGNNFVSFPVVVGACEPTFDRRTSRIVTTDNVTVTAYYFHDSPLCQGRNESHEFKFGVCEVLGETNRSDIWVLTNKTAQVIYNTFYDLSKNCTGKNPVTFPVLVGECEPTFDHGSSRIVNTNNVTVSIAYFRDNGRCS